MTNYHAWKRRLWGPDYPIENGPPYRDPATGAPILPGGIQGGPYQGVDDNGPASGNPVAITISGTATGPGEVVVMIDDQTAAAPDGGRWVGCSYIYDVGDTATEIAAGLAADFNARNHEGWTQASSSGATVTFTPQSAGTATGYVIYQPAQSGVGGGGVPAPISSIAVDTSILPPEGGPAGSTAEVLFTANGSQKSTSHVAADRDKGMVMADLTAELLEMQSIAAVFNDPNTITLVAADGYILDAGEFLVIPPVEDDAPAPAASRKKKTKG